MTSNYRDRLRRLAVSSPGPEGDSVESSNDPRGTNHKTLALARLAALVAVGLPSANSRTQQSVPVRLPTRLSTSL